MGHDIVIEAIPATHIASAGHGFEHHKERLQRSCSSFFACHTEGQTGYRVLLRAPAKNFHAGAVSLPHHNVSHKVVPFADRVHRDVVM
jgi:hypothetical protein